ncbi:MAG TPA: hypothetical protein VF712_18275 [Thermoleophilaceae bacterium]|jgi:hypothetical protein
MADWAVALRKELNRREPRLADAIGLRDGIEGTAFEKTLGELLRWQELRPLNKRFRGLGGDRAGAFFTEVDRAYELEERRLKDIIAAINTSLFRSFGATQIDTEKATDAYGPLLRLLGDGDDLTIVTTNYDPAAWLALKELGKRPETGFDRSPGIRPPIAPEGMVETARATKEAVAVLHLHGAVGWYEKEEDGARRVYEHLPDEPFDPGRGRPVVLYPDPDKDPTRDAVVQDLWQEFDSALEGADVVVVIGHSLNDPALVSKLRTAAEFTDVCIGVYPGPREAFGDGEPTTIAQAEVDRIRENVSLQVDVVPVRFGPGTLGDLSHLESWLCAKERQPSRMPGR